MVITGKLLSYFEPLHIEDDDDVTSANQIITFILFQKMNKIFGCFFRLVISVSFLAWFVNSQLLKYISCF